MNAGFGVARTYRRATGGSTLVTRRARKQAAIAALPNRNAQTVRQMSVSVELMPADCYSLFNAIMGSMREARRAGRKHARTDTPTNTSDVVMNVNGSLVRTP